MSAPIPEPTGEVGGGRTQRQVRPDAIIERLGRKNAALTVQITMQEIAIEDLERELNEAHETIARMMKED